MKKPSTIERAVISAGIVSMVLVAILFTLGVIFILKSMGFF